MRTRIACLLLAALPSLAVAWAAEEPNKKDPSAALQGVWKVTELEVNGKPSELPGVSFWLVVKGDKLYYGGQELAKLTAEPTATPPGIDLAFRNPERVLEGIYSADGDTLKLCVNRQPEGVKERPNVFSTEGKPEWRLLVLKRDKDRKADDLDGLGGFVGLQLRAEDEGKRIVVGGVLDNSPAKKADLKKDDVILKVAGQEVTDLRGCVRMVQSARPGSELTLRVKRGDKELDVTVKVGVVPFFLLD
jgi:uncharacterized protein (TIGR03067 family)